MTGMDVVCARTPPQAVIDGAVTLLAESIRSDLGRKPYVVRVNGRPAAEMSDRHLVEWYERSAARGTEMLRLGKAPRVKSDDTFFQGFTKVGGAQFESDACRNYYLSEARKAGVDVSGKQYFSEIAAYPGDPRAWVGTRGELVKVLEDRGWSADGDIKVRGEIKGEPGGGPPIAEDIVQSMVEDRLEANPEANPLDVREQVIQQHAPAWVE